MSEAGEDEAHAQGGGSGRARGRESAAGGALDDDDAPAGPPLNRMVVAVLGLIGFFVALYLFAHNIGLGGPIVCGVGDCATVQSSAYAHIGPVPVSGIGLAGYVVLTVLAMLGLQPGRRDSRVIGALLLGGATFGVVFSAYLTYLEAAVINAWCQYCVVSAIVITLIFFATLPEVARLTGPRDQRSR